MQIELIGPDANAHATDLDDWLSGEHLQGVRFERQRSYHPGTQGAEWLPVLLGTLSAPAVTKTAVELVRSIFSWAKVRRPKIKINVTLGKDRKFTIDTENVSDIDELLTKILSIISENGENAG
jgi:hypothetical protein